MKGFAVPAMCQNTSKMLPQPCQDCPSYAQDCPKAAQVETKMAILMPSWPLLGATCCHLGPNFAHLPPNLPENSRPSAPETTNRGQRPIQTPISIDFGLLLVTISLDFGIDPNIFRTCLIYVCTGFAQLVRLLIGAAPVVSRSVFNPAQHRQRAAVAV